METLRLALRLPRDICRIHPTHLNLGFIDSSLINSPGELSPLSMTSREYREEHLSRQFAVTAVPYRLAT